MDVLNSREWAILMWILLALGYFFISPAKKKIEGSMTKIFGALVSRHIVSAIVLMSMYVAFIVFCLSNIGLWDLGQTKNTLIWYFAVATFSLFRLNHYREEPARLKRLVADNFRLVCVIEYLVSTYTFHFALEVILVPITFVLSAAATIAEVKPDLKQVHSILNSLLGVIAFGILVATLYLTVTDVAKVTSKESFIGFIVPPILTTLYTPFLAFMVVYATYQNVLIHLRYATKKRHLQLYAALIALVAFNFRTKLLERWSTNVANRNIRTIHDINQSVLQIFHMVAHESNPPKVDRSEGWSPYEAKNYLLSEGIKTRHYHPVDPDDASEWFCCSDLIEFGKGLFQNNIAYYLNGNEHAVKSMKLTLNVNAPEHATEAHAKLLSVASTLAKKALGLDLPDVLSKAITSGTECNVEGSNFRIEFTKSIWPNPIFRETLNKSRQAL